MGKLSFVLDLVECIMELARVRGAALSNFTDSVSCKQVFTAGNVSREVGENETVNWSHLGVYTQ